MALSDRGVQGSPVVLVFEVRSCSIKHQRLGNVETLLRVLAEEIHHEMEDGFAVVVGFVHVCALLDQSLDQPNLELDDC